MRKVADMQINRRSIPVLLLGLAAILLAGESALTAMPGARPRAGMQAQAAPAFVQTVLRVEGMFCGG